MTTPYTPPGLAADAVENALSRLAKNGRYGGRLSDLTQEVAKNAGIKLDASALKRAIDLLVKEGRVVQRNRWLTLPAAERPMGEREGRDRSSGPRPATSSEVAKVHVSPETWTALTLRAEELGVPPSVLTEALLRHGLKQGLAVQVVVNP